MRPLDAALALIRQGYAPVPIPTRKKKPVLKDWPALRITAETAPQYFNGQPQNIGVLLGEPSNGLIDVDLDATEAVHLAVYFLPVTEAVFGRAGKLRSHWLYRVPGLKTKKFEAEDGSMIVEVRSSGCQTVFPPGIHESGQAITWHSEGEPPTVSADVLLRAVSKLAAAALLVRHFPAKGSRDQFTMVLAGTLLRAGMPVEEAEHFIEAVATEAGSEDVSAKVAKVAATGAKLDAGAEVTGLPTLKEVIGDKVAELVSKWLRVPAAVRPSASAEARGAEYLSTPEGLIHRRETRQTIVNVKLTNFTATIAADLAEDDGVEEQHTFEIEAALCGRPPKTFTIPAKHFGAMHWPLEQLGAGAVVYPGQGTKDQARAAIQLLSGEIPQRRIYTSTGWRTVDGRPVYLHADGALSAEGPVPGVEVRLGAVLDAFRLPPLPTDAAQVREAVQASVELLGVAPLRITAPLLGLVYRAVLGNTDFSGALVGPTGAGKSELAALAQQHFGPGMHRLNLPGNWSSTANALEGLAFLAKDVLLVVDDFAPNGNQHEVQQLHQKAERLLRAQGNSSGRGRMRADSTLRPNKPPRGTVLMTGEDLPRGQSLRARIAVMEVSPGDIDWTQLTRAQAHAREGHYAVAMAAYVSWLARHYDTIRGALPGEIITLRTQATGQHKRTPELAANLGVGLRHWLTFAVEVGALTQAESEVIWDRLWTALLDMAERQTDQQVSANPTRRFFALVSAALASGQAHVASEAGQQPDNPGRWGWRYREINGAHGPVATYTPQGPCIGWLEGGELYLEPESAYQAAQRLARDGSDGLAIGITTLSKRLYEAGLLRRVEKRGGKLYYQVRKTLGGVKRRTVLHVGVNTLDNNEGYEDVAPGATEPEVVTPVEPI